MKTNFFLVAVSSFVLFTSCNDASITSTTKSGISQANKNKEINNEIYLAIETGNVSRLDSFFSSNFINHALQNGHIKSVDSLKQEFVRMHDHLKNIKFESIANATDGDYNFDLARLTGITNSDWMGMPANSDVDMMAVNVVKLSHGKIEALWRFADPKNMMNMMNAVHIDKVNDKLIDKIDNSMDNKRMDTIK